MVGVWGPCTSANSDIHATPPQNHQAAPLVFRHILEGVSLPQSMGGVLEWMEVHVFYLWFVGDLVGIWV